MFKFHYELPMKNIVLSFKTLAIQIEDSIHFYYKIFLVCTFL